MKYFYIILLFVNYLFVKQKRNETKMYNLFLPHVFPQFNAKFIANVFQYKHNIGIVSQVDIISKHTTHNSVYVHFESVNLHLTHVRRLFEIINNGEKATLNYKGKYYWNILKNTSKGKNFTVSERKECVDVSSSDSSRSSSPSPLSMKDNKFFSDLVKNCGAIQHKQLDIIKENDTFNTNTQFQLFTKEDYKNMEEIDAALEEEYYMQVFSEEIEEFDRDYFNM